MNPTVAARRAGNLTPCPCGGTHSRSVFPVGRAAQICLRAGATPEQAEAAALVNPALRPLAAAMRRAAR